MSYATSYGARTASDVAIEQARARGLTLDETAEHLNVDPRRVRDVWDAMDDALTTVDQPTPHLQGRRATPEHGTYAAYQQHGNHGEPACTACTAARRRRDARRHRATP